MFGGNNENLGPFTQRLMLPQHPLHLLPGAGGSSGSGLGGDDEFPKRDERVPPWSNQETRDFIAIRGELEIEFSSAKRSNLKNLWEIVAARINERGYRRSAEQCKSKWKTLINRYKGKETSDPDNGGQFPYFDELHALFSSNMNNNVQRVQLESEARKRPRGTSRDRSSEEISEDEGYAYESDEVKLARSNVAPKKKTEKEKRPRTSNAEKASRQANFGSINNNTGRAVDNIQEMLKEFFQHQLRIEMQWRETTEKRAREREVFEQEWRSSMEKLERDRMMIEQSWREREEQRRTREETRAEKRDALLTTLLNKLIGENHP